MKHDLFGHSVRNGYYWGGIRWDMQTSERLENPIYLERYGYKVFSQNDEDGIIQEIFKRIGTTNKKFIEFGVQDGIESNCHYLLFHNWSGLWIEASDNYVQKIHRKFKSVIDTGQLKVIKSLVTRENINALFQSADMSGEIDLLSIDIDGNDYHVWNAVAVVNPRVVIVEYNSTFPPDCPWVMPYKKDHSRDGSDRFGASLKSFEELGINKGYQMVGTCFSGVNAFFVRKDIAGNLFPLPAKAEDLYNPWRQNYRFQNGHRTTRCIYADDACVNMPDTPSMWSKMKTRVKGFLRDC